VDLHKRLGISDSLLDAVKSITEKKKMDPVGKADADIDNDGDVDKSDKYLHNRRKAIKKAMKKDDKKGSGKKDEIDVEPEMSDDNDGGVNEQVEQILESSVKIKYRDKKGKEHFMHVFTAQDAARAEKQLKQAGNTIVGRQFVEVSELDEAWLRELDEAGWIRKLDEVKISDTGWQKTSGPRKDRFGNVIKKQNIAKHLAKQGAAAAAASVKKEEKADGVADQAVDKHNCATHVYHEQWGDGQTVFSMHAEPDEYGLIEWYDVMFEHGIEKRVPTAEMKVTREMSHGNHKKKK